MNPLIAILRTDNIGLIRYSAIVRRLEQAAPELASIFRGDVERIGRVCKIHGYLQDPIVAIEVEQELMVVACPWCSGSEVLARWEAQEVKDGD